MIEGVARRLRDEAGGSALRLLGGSPVRRQAVAILLALLLANLVAWACAWSTFAGDAALMGTALLAYSLGLRHAFDADHISAIDNATRKLMAQGQKPIATGLYFSLGHSAVVWIATLVPALAAQGVRPWFQAIAELGKVVGTGFAVAFLLAIAATNVFVVFQIVRAIGAHRRGQGFDDDAIGKILARRGFVYRLLRPVFDMVSRSAHMFLVGLLFGLGFDTATEIGVLGLSAAASMHGMSIWSILLFPALFTAGMSLVDTLDSLLMVKAYGWAFIDAPRKLYYNLAVTAFSVGVAVTVATIQVLGFLAPAPSFAARVLDWVATHFSDLGALIVLVFAANWLAFAVLGRARRG